MALEDYRRKRRFGQTPEPDDRPRAAPPGRRPIFVVQLHHASHRHYDFRLQVGDVLRSWAVPKGPSLDPSVKRMAVEVEDHPLDYAGFEGEIPAGHYGAGHVALFDRGTWTTEGDVAAQLAKGHLRFTLHGERLKGGWHLVRSGKPARQPQWLLFKQDDAWAGDAEADDRSRSNASALGLTTQVPTREIFLTSGPTRKLRLGNRTVELKHGSRWQLALGKRAAGKAIRALSWLGPEQAPSALHILHAQLPAEEWAALQAARAALPGWMARAVSEANARG